MSHCQDQSCCDSKSGCSCQSSHGSCCGSQKSNSCGCCSKGEDKKSCCDAASKFLDLADCAWKEVLKEKIKEHIKANATHMDELARLIAEANHEIWQKKMEDKNKNCCGSFEEKLEEFFCKTCHTHQHSDSNNPNKPDIQSKRH